MIQRIDVGPRMSEAAVHNGVVYLAGQVATGGAMDFLLSRERHHTLPAVETEPCAFERATQSREGR